jgi:hypothetical protein
MFREGLASLRKGHELGARRPDWPSARITALVRQVEHFIDLDRDLPAFLTGKRQPSGPDEQIELAALCGHPAKRLYAAAARFYADAFAARPALADDLRAGHRYNAACCAALAGCGRGQDQPTPDAQGRARLRRQALDRLRPDLAAWSKLLDSGKPEDRATTIRTLTDWGKDPDLTGVRDQGELEKLPEDERQAWRQLWADVAALLQRAGGQ